MDACYKQSRDEMKGRFADDHYDPNIGGLYELERNDYQGRDFPRGYEGKLIKGLNFCVPRMNVMPDGIRVIFMRRHPEEIRQSYAAFFNKQLLNIDRVGQNMESIIERIENRKDVLSLDVFWYRDVVSEPLRHFELLQRSGWPVSAVRASETVDPQYCRFKLEDLTVGIV